MALSATATDVIQYNVKEPEMNEILHRGSTPDITALSVAATNPLCAANNDELSAIRLLQVDIINGDAEMQLMVGLCGNRSQLIHSLGTVISLLQKLDKVSLSSTTPDQLGITNANEPPVKMTLLIESDAKTDLEITLHGSRNQLIRSLGIILSLLQKQDKMA